MNSASRDTHPLPPGQKIVVFNLVPAKRPFLERHGEIVTPIRSVPHLYLVRFQNDESPRARLVFPGEWQNNPDEVLDVLMAMWRASLDTSFSALAPNF